MIHYCKETGEELIGISDVDGKLQWRCLIHGWQQPSHFEEETNNIKVCAVCGKGFYCEDDVRLTCSLSCAGEMNDTRS